MVNGRDLAWPAFFSSLVLAVLVLRDVLSVLWSGELLCVLAGGCGFWALVFIVFIGVASTAVVVGLAASLSAILGWGRFGRFSKYTFHLAAVLILADFYFLVQRTPSKPVSSFLANLLVMGIAIYVLAYITAFLEYLLRDSLARS